MPKKFASILPWVVVGILFLSVKLQWLPDYYSYLLTSILCLWIFLGDCWELRKNSGQKLGWHKRFNLLLSLFVAVVSLYAFWLRMPH